MPAPNPKKAQMQSRLGYVAHTRRGTVGHQLDANTYSVHLKPESAYTLERVTRAINDAGVLMAPSMVAALAFDQGVQQLERALLDDPAPDIPRQT